MTVRILEGDCRDVLRTLPDESVHCVVTSPPYFGLRDYDVPPTAWPEVTFVPLAGMPAMTVPAMTCCHGLEPDPWSFIAHEVHLFREVYRALRDDGTLWLNIGDSYATKPRGSEAGIDKSRLHNAVNVQSAQRASMRRGRSFGGAKHKDLLGIPWMLAFALRADGWYLRQDIIWSKPNPMPESVTDRCTKAHEYLFLLSKAPRYYYDADAISEPAAYPEGAGNVGPGKYGEAYAAGDERQRSKQGLSKAGPRETRNKRSVWSIATVPNKEEHFAMMPPALAEQCIRAGCPAGGTVLDPFGGAGTTGLVADRLQRDAILIELNPKNVTISERRIAGDAPLLAEVATA